jgi:hypothetical protein
MSIRKLTLPNLGSTLPGRLFRDEAERGLFILRVSCCNIDTIHRQLHHHQDVVVQEEKDVSRMAQLALHHP